MDVTFVENIAYLKKKGDEPHGEETIKKYGSTSVDW